MMRRLTMITFSREPVFIDSSVIVGFLAADREALDLLDRLEESFDLVINDVVFSEVTYRIMYHGYVEKYGRFQVWELRGRIGEFVNAYEVMGDFIRAASLRVVPINQDVVDLAIQLGKAHGLLPNDALIAATCKYYGIRRIATFDKDFEKIDFLEVMR
jgi:predicted nucleic acid-binding protein